MSEESKESLYNRHQDLFNDVFDMIIADMVGEPEFLPDNYICGDGHA